MLLTNYTSALANAKITFNGLNKTETTTPSIVNNLPTKRVLGYAIDDDGYFTEDFNKAAKIPEHIKIHSSTMESMQRALVEAQTHPWFSIFSDIDIAKTIGNAYKVFSQLVDEETLKKESFTKDEIVNLPQGYEFDRTTLEVSKVHQDIFDYLSADSSFNYQNKTNQMINSTFYNPVDWSDRYNPKFAPASDIFNNVNGGKEHEHGLVWDTTSSQYTNTDGTISMGGILTAMVNGNLNLVEGTATYMGQMQGYDRNVDPEKIRAEYYASWGKSVFDYTDRELNMMSEQRRDFIKGMQKEQMKIWVVNGYGIPENARKSLSPYSDDTWSTDPIVAAYEAVDREFKEYLDELRQKLIEERQKAQEEARKQAQEDDVERLYEQSKQTMQEIVQLLKKIEEEANKNKDPKNQWNVSTEALQKAIMDMLNAQNQQAYALANRQQINAQQIGAFDVNV